MTEEYERMNSTFEGMNEKELLDGDPLKLPAQDDDADDDNFKMVKELMMIKMITKMEAQSKSSKILPPAPEGIFDDDERVSQPSKN